MKQITNVILLFILLSPMIGFAQRPGRESSLDTSQAAVSTPIIEFKAQLDKEFDQGSLISSIQLSDSKIKDLALLGRVWGFLKYHHPAIAKGDYNWDYELFRILPKIIEAKKTKEVNNILSKWVSTLGEVTASNNKPVLDENTKLMGDFDWIDAKLLGKQLSSQLINIQYAERPEKHYYVGSYNAGNPEFKNENPYTSMKYPDTGFRLLSLYRYWNIVQYYFPYKYLIDENWNDVLSEFLPKLIKVQDQKEYELTIASLIAKVDDSHASEQNFNKYLGQYYAPLKVDFVENKAVVTDLYRLSDPSKNKKLVDKINKKSRDTIITEDLPKVIKYPKIDLKIGDVIEKINQIPVEDYIQERAKYKSASNYPTLLRDIAGNLLRSNDTLLDIEYSRDNLLYRTQVQCFPVCNLEMYRYLRVDTSFKKITPEIAYLYPEKLYTKHLIALSSEILNSKGLIIDFRCYPNDQSFKILCQDYLLPTVTEFFKASLVSMNEPGLFNMKSSFKVGRYNPDYYKGKVIILVNEDTQSAAEFQSMALRRAPRALIIGSQTAGADGNVSSFNLPGGIGTRITGLGIYYPDGSETQRVGIDIDIEVKPTIQGIKEGRDELLEKAIELINED